ncbi:MAG: branched-chain amino acid ABC transporter permease [Clostridiales bacterium]|nr:branched-chain amino acid ABC transporter permease [Clostridiales bacterium]
MKYKGNSIFKGNFFLIVLGLIFIIVPIFLRTYYKSVFILICLYALTGVAWNFICGYVGTISLGHCLYMGIGAYTSTILLEMLGVSPWIGMFVGAVLATVFGVLINWVTFRLKGPYFTLASIALCELIRTFVTNTDTIGPIRLKGGSGWSLTQTGYQAGLFEFSSKLSYYYIIFIMLLLALLATYKMSKSRLGYYLVAIRSDDDAARSLGVNITRCKLIAMGISCFMISLAGTFYAQYFRYIGPDTVFSHDLAVKIALIALIGGQGTVMGPVVGAIILVPLSELLSARFASSMAGLDLFIYGIVMMLVVFFMPHGIDEHIVRLAQKVEERLFSSGKKSPASDS